MKDSVVQSDSTIPRTVKPKMNKFISTHVKHWDN